MKFSAGAAVAALASLVAADTITVQNLLTPYCTSRGFVGKIPCFRVVFTDGGGSRFSSKCGFASPANTCNGYWENQRSDVDLGGGYIFTSDGKTAYVRSGNGLYNARCVPQGDGRTPGMGCTLTGDTDSQS
ncbi:hypothetical protein RJ55_04696 [Drechmeria coniospora]|nr:hypothetical protein RJ55_04696 [Drechmeria coniospora]